MLAEPTHNTRAAREKAVEVRFLRRRADARVKGPLQVVFPIVLRAPRKA